MALRASHNRNADMASVCSTGCTSIGELAITFRISVVAVCRSSASCVSLNSRTFSIAITAWSANVRDEVDLAGGKLAGDRPGQRENPFDFAVS